MFQGIKKLFGGTLKMTFKNCTITFCQFSYWICLIYCIINLIFYVYGWKERGKHCSASFLAYFIIELLRLALEE